MVGDSASCLTACLMFTISLLGVALPKINLTFAIKGNSNWSWCVMAPSGAIQVFTMIRKEILLVYNPICPDTISNSVADCHIEKPPFCIDGNNFSRIEVSMPNSSAFDKSYGLGISDCDMQE